MLIRRLPRKVQARGPRAQDDGADRARRRHGCAPAHARVPGTLCARDRLPGDGEGRPRQHGETVPGVRRAVRLLPCEGEVTEASVRSESRRALGQRGRRKTERESEGELPVGDAAREPSPEARVEPHVLRRSGLPDDTEARNRAGSHAGVSLRSPRRRGALPSRREAHRLVPRSRRRHWSTAEHHRAFLSCEGNDTLTVFDLDTHSAIADLPMAKGADVVMFDPGLGRIYVACGSGAISVFQMDDPAHFRKLPDFPVEPKIHSLVVDLRTHRVYAPAEEANGRPASKMFVFEAVTN